MLPQSFRNIIPQSQGGHYNLGVCYELGVGTTQNYNEARKCFVQAAKHGKPEATRALKRIDEKIRTESPLVGKRVVVFGTSREDLNGKAGMAVSFDHARGRYVVSIQELSIKLKPGNVRLKDRG